jgi:hypothetical protein
MNTPDSPLDPLVVRTVQETLLNLESDRQLRVLYACESGSRAWGFASQDSDYDVRFLYVHERDWYLSVDDKRDVVELPISGDLDVSGWDLRKALRLLRKSNPALLEWLRSPHVYWSDPVFVERFRVLAEEFYSPRKCFVHYLHMAFGNYRDYLRGRDTVSLKKYLYVLRPLLACRWIERHLTMPPVVFQDLVDQMLEDKEVSEAVAELLARKASGVELAMGPKVEALSRFVEEELVRLDAADQPTDLAGNVEELNEFFRLQALAA